MLAIFDVDGTILDSMGYCNNISERYLIQNNIEPELNLAEKMFSMSFLQGSQYVVDNYPLNKTVEKVKEEILIGLEDYYFNKVKLKDGALEIFEFFKENGVDMVIATSTDSYLIEGSFERLKIKKYFSKIYSPDVLNIPKSSTKFLDTILNEYKVWGRDAILFEDGLYSIKNANKLGINTIGVYDYTSRKIQQELKVNSDLYLETLKDYRGEFLWKQHLQ